MHGEKETNTGKTYRTMPVLYPTIQLVIVILYIKYKLSILYSCRDFFDEIYSEKENETSTGKERISNKKTVLNPTIDEDMDIDTMITTYNTAVTDAASEILGKERRRKKQWVTKDVLDLCDERRDLKKRYETEGAKEYREGNRRIQTAVKKAKEAWIDA